MSKIVENKILVTGGAGFIGSNIVKYLFNNNAKHVRVLDNLSTGYFKNIAGYTNRPNFEFIEGDIRDQGTCQKVCQGMDYALHQAALGSVPRSINDPVTSNDVNVSGFLNMLVAARDQKVKRMVYAASSSTYGDSQGLPKVEDKIGRPLSPYAVTKYVNELYADVFAKTYDMEIIGLRYFNVFGPNQDPNGAYAAVIPKFINLMLNGDAITINGDGIISRDFTYVDNAILANVKAILSENKYATNQVYNVACGDSTSLNQLVDILIKETGSQSKIIHRPNRKGDIKHSLADVSKAKKRIGYVPEIGINEGLKRTVNWFKENR